MLRATKTHRSYSVAIDEGTLTVLVDHWRQALARAECVGANLTVDSFVFSSDPAGTRPWLPNRVTKRFIHHRRRTGLGHFRLHDLRHFMATEMLGHGVPVPTVSQRLGHARASTTLNVYAHRVPGSDRDAADLLGGLLDPNGTPTVDRRRRHTNQRPHDCRPADSRDVVTDRSTDELTERIARLRRQPHKAQLRRETTSRRSTTSPAHPCAGRRPPLRCTASATRTRRPIALGGRVSAEQLQRAARGPLPSALSQSIGGLRRVVIGCHRPNPLCVKRRFGWVAGRAWFDRWCPPA